MNKDHTWFAIVNPSSANGRTKNRWPAYHQMIQEAGCNIAYEYTSGPGKGAELTAQAIGAGYSKIIAVGGDGTVNEVVNGLLRDDQPLAEDVQLAILEHGTGSDFVRSYKKNSKINSFITTLKTVNTLRIDVGKVTFQGFQKKSESRYFINAANLGIGAETVHKVNSGSKILGSKLTYFTGTIGAILSYQNMPAAFKVDDSQEITGTYCGLIICNGQYIGGGMQIAPEAQIDDGLFDLIVIKDISKLTLLRRFPLIYQGKHIELPEIALHRCQNLKIIIPDSMPLETDGEIIGFSPKEFQVIPQCLTLRI